MAYNVDDITKLIRYHLVLSEVDDQRADRNLAELARNIEQMMTRQPHYFIEWMTCDDCGASVTTELIDPDGAGWTYDDSFRCSDCRQADSEPP